MIVEARELQKARSTFVDSILKHQVNGRIHAELHPLRSDQGGTVTGRFSCSNPNLQQIPSRPRHRAAYTQLIYPRTRNCLGCVRLL